MKQRYLYYIHVSWNNNYSYVQLKWQDPKTLYYTALDSGCHDDSKYILWIICLQLLDVFVLIHFAPWFLLPALPLCISRRGWVDSKRIKLRWWFIFPTLLYLFIRWTWWNGKYCMICRDLDWIICLFEIKANYDSFQRWTLHRFFFRSWNNGVRCMCLYIFVLV